MEFSENSNKQQRTTTSAGGRKFTGRLLCYFAVIAFAFILLPSSKLDLAGYTNAILSDEALTQLAPTTSILPTFKRTKVLVPKIYSDVRNMPNLTSSGPYLANPQIAGGLYEFNDVCVTKHASSSFLRGLVYFAPHDDDLASNDLRCAHCSAPLNHRGGWNGTGRDEKQVSHRCGFQCMHLSYARNAADWVRCMENPLVRRKMEVWGQAQSPARAESVHYYEDPVYLLNFRPENIGHSLFDTMLVWLPHWDYYRSQMNNHFPFKHVISDSLEGCLSTNEHHWFCEILRAMEAFGDDPRELPSKPNNTTLYCYKSLYVSHIAQQRQMSHPEWLPKRVFDSFRDVLFEKYNLPRRRRVHHGDVLRAASDSNNNTQRLAARSKRILFYAHEPSGRRVWNGMNELIEGARNLTKYRGLHFEVVRKFNLPITRQAMLFNEADAHVMVHGAQMANSIFSVDGTFFVEIGCLIPVFISTSKFLKLIDGKYRAVTNCGGDRAANVPCLVCGEDQLYGNFTMKSEAFESLMDEVLQKLEQPKSR